MGVYNQGLQQEPLMGVYTSKPQLGYNQGLQQEPLMGVYK